MRWLANNENDNDPSSYTVATRCPAVPLMAPVRRASNRIALVCVGAALLRRPPLARAMLPLPMHELVRFTKLAAVVAGGNGALNLAGKGKSATRVQHP